MEKQFVSFASVLGFILLTILSTGIIYSQGARNDVQELNLHGKRLIPAGRGTADQLQTFSFGLRGERLSAWRMSTPPPHAEKLRRCILKPSRSSGSNVSVVDTATVVSTYDTTIYIYGYNSSGSIISESVKKWTNSQWVDSCHYMYTYDASGHRLTELYERWMDSQWVNSDSSIYTYDANGNELTGLDEQWTDSQWVNSDSSTYTYDASGQLLSLLVELWTNGQWVNSIRITDGYDTDGRWVSWSEEQWTNGQWVNVTMETYTYDSNGRFLSGLDEQWTSGQWVNVFRTMNSYYVNGNILSVMSQQWMNSQWVNSDSSTYTYDASGRTLTELNDYWTDSQWVNHDSTTYAYDASGSTLSELCEEWMNGQWVNDWRYIYTYGPTELWTTGKHEIWEDSLWTPADEDLDFSDGAGNYFDYTASNVSIIYELIITGVISATVEIPSHYFLLQNYPNPFNPTTTISYEIPIRSHVTLSVYNTLGQKISELVNTEKEPGVYDVTFDASGFASGVYFYRIQAGSFVQTKKIVLVK